MEILITGGTGFIGRHLCRRLREAGHRITVLSRQGTYQVQSVCGNVEAVRDFDRVSGAPEVVINLAGEPILGPRWSRARKEALWASRVDLTRRLVAWMGVRSQRPRLLLSASAVGYYGDQGDRILDERMAAEGDDFGSRLCRAWEEAAMVAETLGVRVCRMRIGPVLGRDGGMLPRLLPAFRWGLGGPLGSGHQWLSWIHLEDLLAMILTLMEEESATGAYNLTAPQPVTSRQFAAALGRVLHRPARLAVPAPLLKLLLGEQAQVLLGSQRVLPERFIGADFPFRHPHLEGALEDLLRS